MKLGSPPFSVDDKANPMKAKGVGGLMRVESTMRSAYERGFRVVTLIDCTATLSSEEQHAAVTRNFPMFSRRTTGAAFIAKLQSGQPS